MTHTLDQNTIVVLLAIAAPCYCLAIVFGSLWYVRRTELASQLARNAAFAKTLYYLGSRERRDLLGSKSITPERADDRAI